MNTAPTEDLFGHAIPDEERLDNLAVISLGLRGLFEHLLDRLASYHDLLEVEMENSPAAELYLQEAGASLERCQSLIACWQGILGAVQAGEFESFDLKVFLQGIVKRLERMGRPGVNLDLAAVAEEESYLAGRLLLLQEAFFALVRLVAGERSGSALHLGLNTRRVDEAFQREHKADLALGEYYLITLGLGQTAPSLIDLISVRDQLASPKPVRLSQELVLAEGVATLHGGGLFVPKSGGAPEAVALLLPARPAGERMFGERTLEKDDLRGRETVLLVDDEAIIWDVVIDMLQGLGYTVILAANGLDCVEIYRENPGQIDVVLLDMVMPEMNGRDAFFALREIDPEAKVILQSGYVAEEDARDVLDAGAVGFLRKPYRMADLARKIRQVCQ